MKHFLKITCFVSLLFALSILRITAQENASLSEYLPNYTTDNPSGLYNGKPIISIPLYTLKARGISIPVSLSYDASGITIHQEATSVGLGWVLNAGGFIIHETRDWLDFAGVKRLDSEENAGVEAKFTGDPPVLCENCDIAKLVSDYMLLHPHENEYDVYSRLQSTVPFYYVRHKVDNQPDIFYYNCGALAGKFILSSDLTKGVSIPESNVKIKIDPNSKNITITSDNGTVYSFEHVNTINKYGNIGTAIENTMTASIIYQLKTIYTPQFDTIEYTYQSANYYKQEFRAIYDDISSDEYFMNTTLRAMPLHLVKQISVRGGETIEFEFGNRRQDAFAAAPDSVPTIKRVKLLDAQGNVKRYFELYHSYFVSDPFLQYLPKGKSTQYQPGIDDPLTFESTLLGDYNIKINQQDGTLTYVTYKNLTASFPITGDNTVYGDLNGQRVALPSNYFGRGNYLFTRENGKLYAVLNDDYLKINPPQFNKQFPVYDSQRSILYYLDDISNYYAELRSYEELMRKYYSLDAQQPIHLTTKNDGGLHYFEVDENYINFLVRIGGANYRPYYNSHYTSLKLRLDSLKEISDYPSQSNPAIAFEYNPTKLPHNCSNDFDHWGYYNYKEGMPNISPVPIGASRTSLFNTDIYGDPNSTSFGTEAEKSPVYKLPTEARMKAAVLEKIKYPNGGYVKYTYEANRARTNATGTTEAIVGGLRLKSTETSTGEGEKYFTTYEYKEYVDDKVNGSYKLNATNIGSGYLYSKEVQYEVGKNIKLDLTGTSVNINLPGVINAQDPTYSYFLKTMGVMNSVIPLAKTNGGYVGYSHVAVHKQDALGNSLGTNLYRFNANGSMQYLPFSSSPSAFGQQFDDFMKYGSQILPADPMLGSMQEKIVADKSGNIVAKTTYDYSLTSPHPQEDSLYCKQFNQSYSIQLGPYIWKMYILPSPLNFDGYIAPEVPVTSAVRNYSYFPTSGKELADSTFYLYDQHGSQYEINDHTIDELVTDPELYDNIYANNTHFDPLFEGYGDAISGHGYKSFYTGKLLQELHFKPNGDRVRTRYWYPPHLSQPGNVFEKMVQRNIISPAVRVEKFLNGERLEGKKTDYAVFSKEGSTAEDFILPSSTSVYHTNAYEQENQITKYNDGGMLTESNNTNGNQSSIIWEYNKSLPVAQVENSGLSQVAYTSFENSAPINSNTDLNNWQVIDGASWTLNTVEKRTGKQSLGCSGNNVTISTKNDMPAGTYRLSFWARNYTTGTSGQFTATSHPVPQSTGDAWQLYTTMVTISAPQKIVLTCSLCLIDELRLCPSNARMTTSTYDPLYGVTSKTDINNVTTYYEYDGFGRLIRIKDQDGNILKETKYHYQGQQ